MADLFGSKMSKTLYTPDLQITGHLLRMKDVVIQISNVSMVTSAEAPIPGFPFWTFGAILAGIILCVFGGGTGYYSNRISTMSGIGIMTIGIGITVIGVWVYLAYDATTHKCLNIMLNSGYTYSIVFRDTQFLEKVMIVFSNIFRRGTTADTNYYINVKDSTISGAVVRN